MKFQVVLIEATADEYARLVANLSGHQPVQHIAGMDEFDVLPAAKVREHLQISKE